MAKKFLCGKLCWKQKLFMYGLQTWGTFHEEEIELFKAELVDVRWLIV